MEIYRKRLIAQLLDVFHYGFIALSVGFLVLVIFMIPNVIFNSTNKALANNFLVIGTVLSSTLIFISFYGKMFFDLYSKGVTFGYRKQKLEFSMTSENKLIFAMSRTLGRIFYTFVIITLFGAIIHILTVLMSKGEKDLLDLVLNSKVKTV